MRMPGMDGPSAARAIRARGDETPIVALTANVFAEDRKACLEAGMDDHLVKPLELEALRASLTRWTNRADRAKVAVG
jgi:CheY-like chemotaxis protein